MPDPIPLPDVVELAIADRLGSDSTLETILGGAGRIKHGFPVEILTNPAETEFPRVTFFVPTGFEIRPELGEQRIQLDLWAWPSGASGTWDKIKATDGRVLALLDEQTWNFATGGETFRLYGFNARNAGFPDTSSVLRRTRELDVSIGKL